MGRAVLGRRLRRQHRAPTCAGAQCRGGAAEEGVQGPRGILAAGFQPARGVPLDVKHRIVD
jgi:hypothetical protein